MSLVSCTGECQAACDSGSDRVSYGVPPGVLGRERPPASSTRPSRAACARPRSDREESRGWVGNRGAC